MRERAAKILCCILSMFGSFFAGIARWLGGLARAILNLWRALGPHWLRLTFVVIVVAVFAFVKIRDYFTPNLTEERIEVVHYLNEGWTEKDRQSYYYTPQGTELLGLHYDWLVNLELPFSHELLATEENMRGWGFIVSPAQRATAMNPGNLPVGFGRHIDPDTGVEKLDIGCATCHTGELHYRGVALRVDGGQAVQSLANAKRGEFITTLGAAVFETLLNPAKWDRFATRLTGDDEAERKKLRKAMWRYAKKMREFSSTAGAAKYYPVEEGRGRTDAVGRIGNVVFGYNLREPDNYRVADAPASYPFIWDIWRFDWVQYTGFTNQPMARNTGESLGVLAPIRLVDKKGKVLEGSTFGKSSVDIEGLHCTEGLLRTLKPPRWPEEILGKIDLEKAKQGKALFADQCVFCHGPHPSEPYKWPIASEDNQMVVGQNNVNWRWDMAGDVVQKDGQYFRPDWRERIWAVPWIDVDVVGTDPKLADNYMDHRYDASKLVPNTEPVNAGDGLQLLLNILVPIMYEREGIPAKAVPDFDGLNVPFRIENKRAYKSRPLHGVWATPPFLHNGSVPTIYHLLSPLRERPTTFYVGNREYDPQHLGYQREYSVGSFKHDTQIEGNQNTGHLFTDVDMPGRIGDLLSEEERFALLEYLKIMGNPEFAEALGGDPLDWRQYSAPPTSPYAKESCRQSHLHHGLSIAENSP